MYTLEDLVASVTLTLRMPSVTSTEITLHLNNCYDYVASQVLLTSLESSGVATSVVDSISTEIPTDWLYHRNLFSCEVEDNSPITILNSKEHLRRIYPDFETVKQSGTIDYLVVSGSSIIYYPIPSDPVELVCGYFKIPTWLEKPIEGYSCGCDELVTIPIGLQPKLLESYICWKIWQRVEDGIEGRKVNTAYYYNLFKEALVELEDTTDVGQSRRLVYRSSNWI